MTNDSKNIEQEFGNLRNVLNHTLNQPLSLNSLIDATPRSLKPNDCLHSANLHTYIGVPIEFSKSMLDDYTYYLNHYSKHTNLSFEEFATHLFYLKYGRIVKEINQLKMLYLFHQFTQFKK